MDPTLIPRDIPLALPADSVLLQTLLVLLFLWHILFVNLMVGGSVLTTVFEVLGRRRPRFDALAREIAGTVTVNKSLAVAFGVGPLLAINVLYTVHFYSANALTGAAWISIVPLVTVAFLITYLHKYTWDRMAKSWHIVLGGLGAAMFLFIPLIFLGNINLMLFPAKWLEVRGFASAFAVGNAGPRYWHFLTASLAVSSLFFVVYFLRAGYPLENEAAGSDAGRPAPTLLRHRPRCDLRPAAVRPPGAAHPAEDRPEHDALRRDRRRGDVCRGGGLADEPRGGPPRRARHAARRRDLRADHADRLRDGLWPAHLPRERAP